MYRFFIIFFLFSFSFFSCSKPQKREEQKKQISFSPPVTIAASHPIVTQLDTCPKPLVIDIPSKGSRNYSIPTFDGPKIVSVNPPFERKLSAGDADGTPYMQHYSTEQGLALSTVSCGFTDRKGNLWFGTSGGGVSRYDGKSFTNFNISQGLAGAVIKCICEDRTGNLWFGTNGNGASKYDGKSFKSYTVKQGMASNTIFSTLEDKKGNIWFGTTNGVSKYNNVNINRLEENEFTNITMPHGVLNNHVLSIAEDKQGNLWFGTLGGASKYDGKSFVNYTTEEGLPDNRVTSIIEDKYGNIWLGTGSGASKYNPENKNKDGDKLFTNYFFGQTNLAAMYVHFIKEDREGNIWFATGGGLRKYDPAAKSFINITNVVGLENSLVYSIVEDKTGNLWFCTAGYGLFKYDGKSLTGFSTGEGLIAGTVWNIAEDKTGNIWLGSSAGLSKYNGKTFSGTIVKYITSNVRCIIKDKNGNLWFGSAFGASQFDEKSLTSYTMVKGLLNKGVLSMIQDSKGNFWIGMYGNGVFKYDGRSFSNYTTSQGLPNNIIKCMAEDKNGNIWFGTNGNGVSKFDGKSFTNYTTAQGLANNSVLSSIADKAGNLWFGTFGGGVSKYDGKSFINFTTAQGLANDVVYAIAEDTLNRILWCGTNSGLSGLKLNSISSEASSVKFENFNSSNGYPIKDVNTGALYIDKKGIIWAGTSDKLIRFDYKAIHKTAAAPEVVLQSLKVQGEPVTWYNLQSKKTLKAGTDKFAAEDFQNLGSLEGLSTEDSLAVLNEEVVDFGHPLNSDQRASMHKKFGDIKFDSIARFYPLPVNLVLPFKNNNITFDFAAIEPGKPQLVRYQFFLQGYDNDWSPIADKTSASFGNIYEGSYTFKLKACSPDGIWSEPVLYTFKVLPPWYRTWWMYLSYLLAVFSVFGLFFRWRTASLRKEKELLEQLVKERTAEVVEQKDLLVEQKDLLVEQKGLIEEKQKEIVDSINYAKRIQYTLLADDEVLKQNLKDHFVLFKPKDIVSGDFYWAASVIVEDELIVGSEKIPTRFYLAVCDSTGHGVPGAFMSLLNISFLNEAIIEKNVKQPNEILNHVRQRLIESISKDGAQDGMDGILVCFENDKITYSAANNAPVIVRDNSIINLAADKMPIGKGEKNNSFTLHTIDTKPGDVIYFYTDGYADQFGGPKGKKFKYKQLEELLISIHKKTMEEQKQILAEAIEKWKGNIEQVDDILIVGMRIGYE